MGDARKGVRRSASKEFAAIEKISICGVTERMGPLGLHLYAEKFLDAARALPNSDVPFEPVRAYLVCHSIELALKAYLSLHGELMLELADGQFGHRLSHLLAKAEIAGLLSFVPLSDSQRQAIRTAETYYAGKVFEYPAIGEAMMAYPQMPSLAVLLDAATLLVDSLSKPCNEAK